MGLGGGRGLEKVAAVKCSYNASMLGGVELGSGMISKPDSPWIVALVWCMDAWVCCMGAWVVGNWWGK